MDRHLATSLIISSQPLMLLLAAAVYDLPTGTVSLCLAVDSARTAVRRSTMLAWQSGTRCLKNLEILTVKTVLNVSWKTFPLVDTSETSTLEISSERDTLYKSTFYSLIIISTAAENTGLPIQVKCACLPITILSNIALYPISPLPVDTVLIVVFSTNNNTIQYCSVPNIALTCRRRNVFR